MPDFKLEYKNLPPALIVSGLLHTHLDGTRLAQFAMSTLGSQFLVIISECYVSLGGFILEVILAINYVSTTDIGGASVLLAPGYADKIFHCSLGTPR